MLLVLAALAGSFYWPVAPAAAANRARPPQATAPSRWTSAATSPSGRNR